MRVIAGQFKGRILNDFENSSTRPTLDRVKESIFSKIQFDVEDAIVLDLFSGTGALGIESLSRGAKHCFFVDNNKTAFNLIKKNISLVNAEQNSTVLFSAFNVALEKFKSDNVKFDVVLLDPPFRKGLGKLAIEKLLQLELLNNNALVVLECAKEEETLIFEQLSTPDVKTYGTVKVAYYAFEK